MAEYNRKQNTSSVCAQAGFNAKCEKSVGEMLIHVWGKFKRAFFVSLK